MSKVAVVGAGYAGMICACALWKQGQEVILIGPESKPFGRTFSLLHGTILALESIFDINISDEIHTLQTLSLSHHKRLGRLNIHAHEHDLPFLLGSIPEQFLHELLLKKINESGITWLKTSLESIDLEQNTLRTGDNHIQAFDYILACDGQKSSTRDFSEIQAYHINPFTQTSMQLISTEKPLSNAAQMFASDAVYACVPLADNQAAIYITSYDPAPHPFNERNELISLIPHLNHSTCQTTSPVFTFKSANHLYPAQHKNLTLMGEAAHSQGPVGAQGINGLICDLGIFLHF